MTSDWIHHVPVDRRFPRELSQELPLPYGWGASFSRNSNIWWSWRREGRRIFVGQVLLDSFHRPEAIRILYSLFLSECDQYWIILLSSDNPSVRNGILERSIYPPLCPSLFLRRYPGHHLLDCWWSLPTPRTGHHFQLCMYHYRIQHAWVFYPGRSPVRWNISRNWCICEQLGSDECLSSQ